MTEPAQSTTVDPKSVLLARRNLTDAMQAMHRQRAYVSEELALRLDKAWEMYDAATTTAGQSGLAEERDAAVDLVIGLRAENTRLRARIGTDEVVFREMGEERQRLAKRAEAAAAETERLRTSLVRATEEIALHFPESDLFRKRMASIIEPVIASLDKAGQQQPDRAFQDAPVDDEEETDEERAAVAEARDDIRAGRTKPWDQQQAQEAE